jgi:hypothetical protein
MLIIIHTMYCTPPLPSPALPEEGLDGGDVDCLPLVLSFAERQSHHILIARFPSSLALSLWEIHPFASLPWGLREGDGAQAVELWRENFDDIGLLRVGAGSVAGGTVGGRREGCLGGALLYSGGRGVHWRAGWGMEPIIFCLWRSEEGGRGEYLGEPLDFRRGPGEVRLLTLRELQIRGIGDVARRRGAHSDAAGADPPPVVSSGTSQGARGAVDIQHGRTGLRGRWGEEGGERGVLARLRVRERGGEGFHERLASSPNAMSEATLLGAGEMGGRAEIWMVPWQPRGNGGVCFVGVVTLAEIGKSHSRFLQQSGVQGELQQLLLVDERARGR